MAGESGSLLIHPKMTGQLVLTSGGATVFAGGHPTPSMLRPMPNATTRAIFRLGPDPLGGNFTPAALREALARHPRAPVKAVLLNQTAVAGIGNIYAG